MINNAISLDFSVDNNNFYRVVTSDEKFASRIMGKLRNMDVMGHVKTCIFEEAEEKKYEFNHLLLNNLRESLDDCFSSVELWTHSTEIGKDYDVLVFGYDNGILYFGV